MHIKLTNFFLQYFSLWFMVLPAYVKQCQSVTKALNVAYDVLKTMQKQNLKSLDEVKTL